MLFVNTEKNKAEHAVQSYATGVKYLSMEGLKMLVHTEQMLDICQAYSMSMQSIFHEHAKYMLLTFWKFAINILNICYEWYAEHMQRSCWLYAKIMLSTF